MDSVSTGGLNGSTGSWSVDEIKKLEYICGGYFRVKAPKGQTSKIIHGPEFLRLTLTLIDLMERACENKDNS